MQDGGLRTRGSAAQRTRRNPFNLEFSQNETDYGLDSHFGQRVFTTLLWKETMVNLVLSMESAVYAFSLISPAKLVNLCILLQAEAAHSCGSLQLILATGHLLRQD
jgi:hypothetical protein